MKHLSFIFMIDDFGYLVGKTRRYLKACELIY